jgi:hypothetical protein
VQESGKAFHQAQDANGQRSPERKNGPKNNSAIPRNIDKVKKLSKMNRKKLLFHSNNVKAILKNQQATNIH